MVITGDEVIPGLMETCNLGGVVGPFVSDWEDWTAGLECRRSESCLRDGKRVMRGLPTDSALYCEALGILGKEGRVG